MGFITYIGNKRKLVDNICSSVSKHIDSGRVLDLFSGSGVVSYHLRQYGYETWANDIANYSFYINKTYLEMTEEFLRDTYPDLNDYIKHLNSLTRPNSDFFFSKHYSENDEEQCRLFYTRENGLIVDAMLEEIWGQDDENLRAIILCSLIYKMSKHVNTSGVFKAYYKQFGGKNADALGRIAARIKINRPVLPPGPIGRSLQSDALTFFQGSVPRFDAVYLDPPYNQHQYSANYHLLEQASKPLNERYIPKDDQVSGIQPDLYKSPFCSKKKHIESLESVIEGCYKSTRLLVLSYNSTSFITVQEMEKLLQKWGEVERKEFSYSTFRGGQARPGAKRPAKKIKEYIFTILFNPHV